ncbi:hypothetical protein RvVAT039_pl03180 (plasmid) [Agrobacterium vitis]|uniref:winged helix-turn-helix transcriptional regulator n=1 Tax=Agrobacterium vitis TaxID=373 RepID=UPI0015D9AFA9|nr:helix-turn-helix domain-containing protein [Agrobacterium vitis]BCH67485.1 hypothetical protein RvVAT039_pl03180 [Agrobacterium vitis]
MQAAEQKETNYRECICVEEVLRLLSGKWKGMILYHLLNFGPIRFAALHRQMPKVTARMLAIQLRELEGNGLVSRSVFPEVPPRVVYSLTPKGRGLEPVIVAMEQWGREHFQDEIFH